ncbi:MAG: AsmA family protein [Draconibacterium sp.]|nr:AsmA family protein [Draconibacterium sp.]
MIKKVLKYLLILTAGVFLLVILSLLFTQTAMFRNIVKNKFTEFATSQWNIQIEINQIDGNFYSNLELVGVSVANNNKALISFSSLKLDYNILELRDRRIVADSVLLKNPSFNIWQNTDSTWNFIELFRNKEKDTLKNRKPFKFAVHANYVAIKNGNIAVSSFIDLIPTSVTGLNIEVDGVYSTENIVVNLRRLIFKTEKPTLNIKEFRTLFTMENKMLGVENLVLRTSGSNIFIDANFHGLNNLDAEIEVNPIDKQELSIFLPSLKLVCSPEIKTQIQIKNDTTIAQIELQNGEQSVLVDAKFHSLKKAMEDKNAKVPYFATVTLKNIAPEKWVEMKKTESIINGKINLSSSNLLNYKLPINVNANLQNSVYNGRLFSKLLVNGIYTNNNIETEIELQTESGGAFINGKIANITSVPVYDISIITNDLNLTSFFPEINSTVLNGQIEAKGEGFTNSTRNIEAIILLENSTVYKIPVNSAEIKVRMNNQEIFIDSLKMLMPGGAASALGEFDLTSKYLSSDIHVDADSLSFLSKFISLPVNFTSLTTDANIQGATNNLVVSGDALINNAEGYSLKSDKLVTTYSVSLKKDSLRVKAKLKANTLVTEPIVWDTINAELDFFDNTIIADINALWNDTLEANIKTKIWLGDTLLIELPMFNAKSFFSHYYLADTLQSVQIHKNSVNINNLWVKDYNQPEFNLKMQGDLSFKQSENIQLSIEHLDLKPFNSFIELEDSISGELFSNFSVTGSAHNPTVE